MEATLSSKGQATIPKAVRERLQIKPGDRFKFFFHPDGVIILPKVPTQRLRGSVPKLPRSVSLKDIDKAIEAGASERFRREEMIGIDTNVLLRYLVQDDPTQSPKATEIIERRGTKEDPAFVSLVSILEIVWALGSLYKRTRGEIADHIEMILAADTLEVQNEQEVYQAVIALRNGSGTFEDALIGALGAWWGCSATVTFDENASKRLNGFQLL